MKAGRALTRRRLTKHIIFILVLAALAGSDPASAEKFNRVAERDAKAEMRSRRSDLSRVTSWAIQLRYIDRSAIERAPIDLAVIDHAPHPKKDVEIPFTRADVEAMKLREGGRRRIVLAYLSIGEAEVYRYYWNPAWQAEATRPKWLGKENPAWPGDYQVDFSHPEWQSLIFGSPDSFLDRIMAAGFDGVYLDRADAFQDVDETMPGAEDAMSRFVSRLADYAHRKDGRFLVIMQNAEELAKSKSLLARLDGIAKEDLLFGHDNSETENPKQMVADSLGYLRQAKRAGLRVFVLEYVRAGKDIETARQIARREGFVLHLTDRLLGVLSLDEKASPLSPTPVSRP